MSFIKVLTDVDGRVTNLPARIVSTESNGTFNIQYLSKTERKIHGKTVYEYETDIYNITDESIDEYMYDESDMDFIQLDGEWVKDRDTIIYDSDYVPSSDGEESEEDLESEEDEDEEDSSECDEEDDE
jgi:hypothetical protein